MSPKCNKKPYFIIKIDKLCKEYNSKIQEIILKTKTLLSPENLGKIDAFKSEEKVDAVDNILNTIKAFEDKFEPFSRLLTKNYHLKDDTFEILQAYESNFKIFSHLKENILTNLKWFGGMSAKLALKQQNNMDKFYVTIKTCHEVISLLEENEYLQKDLQENLQIADEVYQGANESDAEEICKLKEELNSIKSKSDNVLKQISDIKSEITVMKRYKRDLMDRFKFYDDNVNLLNETVKNGDQWKKAEVNHKMEKLIEEKSLELDQCCLEKLLHQEQISKLRFQFETSHLFSMVFNKDDDSLMKLMEVLKGHQLCLDQFCLEIDCKFNELQMKLEGCAGKEKEYLSKCMKEIGQNKKEIEAISKQLKEVNGNDDNKYDDDIKLLAKNISKRNVELTMAYLRLHQQVNSLLLRHSLVEKNKNGSQRETGNGSIETKSGGEEEEGSDSELVNFTIEKQENVQKDHLEKSESLKRELALLKLKAIENEELKFKEKNLQNQVLRQQILIAPYKKQLKEYEKERIQLMGETEQAEQEVEDKTKKLTAVLGHQNEKQKIHHVPQIHQRLKELQKLNEKLKKKDAEQTQLIDDLRKQLEVTEVTKDGVPGDPEDSSVNHLTKNEQAKPQSSKSQSCKSRRKSSYKSPTPFLTIPKSPFELRDEREAKLKKRNSVLQKSPLDGAKDPSKSSKSPEEKPPNAESPLKTGPIKGDSLKSPIGVPRSRTYIKLETLLKAIPSVKVISKSAMNLLSGTSLNFPLSSSSAIQDKSCFDSGNSSAENLTKSLEAFTISSESLVMPELTSASLVDLPSAGSVDLTSGGFVDLTFAGSVDLTSGGSADLTSATSMELTSGSSVELTSASSMEFPSKHSTLSLSRCSVDSAIKSSMDSLRSSTKSLIEHTSKSPSPNQTRKLKKSSSSKSIDLSPSTRITIPKSPFKHREKSQRKRCEGCKENKSPNSGSPRNEEQSSKKFSPLRLTIPVSPFKKNRTPDRPNENFGENPLRKVGSNDLLMKVD